MSLDHTSIHSLIIDGAHTRLEQMLKIDISDAARAAIVRPGRLQDDPTVTGINVLIHHGDEEWPDEINKEDEGPLMFAPTYEIGGQSQYWWRRYIVEFDIFFEGVTRTDARVKTQVVLSRAAHALVTWDVAADTARDTFGESAQAMQVRKQWMSEGGGEGDFNWRCKLYYEVLTHLDPTAPADLP